MKSEKKVDGKIFSHTVALFEVAVEQTFFCSRMNKWSSFSFHHHHRFTTSSFFFCHFLKLFTSLGCRLSKNADAVKPVGLRRIGGFGPKAGQDWA